MPERIQRKRAKGWKMPPNTVSVTRPGKWGNPFRPGSWDEPGFAPVPDDATMAVNWYREDLKKVLRANPDCLAPLRGKNLACWCPVGSPCHADVLLEFANNCRNCGDPVSEEAFCGMCREMGCSLSRTAKRTPEK